MWQIGTDFLRAESKAVPIQPRRHRTWSGLTAVQSHLEGNSAPRFGSLLDYGECERSDRQSDAA